MCGSIEKWHSEAALDNVQRLKRNSKKSFAIEKLDKNLQHFIVTLGTVCIRRAATTDKESRKVTKLSMFLKPNMKEVLKIRSRCLWSTPHAQRFKNSIATSANNSTLKTSHELSRKSMRSHAFISLVPSKITVCTSFTFLWSEKCKWIFIIL